MNWILYLSLYCGICFIVFTCVYVYNIRKGENILDSDLRVNIALILIVPFLPVLYIVFSIHEIITKIRGKKQESDNLIVHDPNFFKKLEKERKRIKKKLGLRSDENYLSFSDMCGVGKIRCRDCGYIEEEVVQFIHTPWFISSGRQCPNCYSFVVENHKVVKDKVVDGDKDFLCPKCGTLIRKKDEWYNDEAPLFCPKCHSPRLDWRFEYIT